jgi:hypothetical protein
MKNYVLCASSTNQESASSTILEKFGVGGDIKMNYRNL